VQPFARGLSLWVAGPIRGAGNVAAAALTWWLGELRAVVPTRLRDALAGDGQDFRVRVDGNFIHIDGAQGSDAGWDLPLEGDGDLPSDLQARLRGGAGAVLVLPAAAVLRRAVELPLAASSELYSATSFLVERFSPFRLEQACHTARLIARDKARKLLRVEMAVVPRQILEALLAALSARSIPLSAVRIEGDTGKPPFDFLPRQRRSRFHWQARQAWRPVLAAGLVLMVVGPLAVAYRAHAEANALAADVAQLAGVGGRAAALRTEVEARAAAEAFMTARQRRPKAIEVVDALTRTLPDDTWVFRMDLRPGQVVLAGLSSDVPALLERLTVAPPFATPELVSPVAHGLAGGKSRFEIRVEVRAPES
jgi:general secretion pathway protein L